MARLHSRDWVADANWAWITGLKSVTLTRGAGSTVITYEEDADQTAPTFITARCSGTVNQKPPGCGVCAVEITGLTDGAPPGPAVARIGVRELGNGTYSGTVQVAWIVMGRVV